MAQLFRRSLVLPQSGDALTDWFFRQFIAILKTEEVRIGRKKRLVNPDDPHRKVIRGLMDPDLDPEGALVHIFINPSRTTHRNRDEEVETLVHELAHVILPKTPERSIFGIERILARRLTRAQRTFLKAFLPRHEIKHYPRLVAHQRVVAV
jgi:hypothetical protein